MRNEDQFVCDLPNGLSLRSELALRNLKLARDHELLYECTDGEIPSIIFGRDDAGRHGNFHPAVYQRIYANSDWVKRLDKVHTSSRRARIRSNWQWKELDCANSSDALLMNVFCHPQAMTLGVCAMLGVGQDAVPLYGFRPRTPLHAGKYDNTEVDMQLGDLLVEAKLTESDFQCCRFGLIERYRDLDTVFNLSDLPSRDGRHSAYQLIRGTLAAHATGYSFCVLCDSRRPDLIEHWYTVMRAVRLYELRCRLKLLTWQELSAVLVEDLQDFLAAKYGIFPAQ